jgi:hypothetical protein
MSRITCKCQYKHIHQLKMPHHPTTRHPNARLSPVRLTHLQCQYSLFRASPSPPAPGALPAEAHKQAQLSRLTRLRCQYS